MLFTISQLSIIPAFIMALPGLSKKKQNNVRLVSVVIIIASLAQLIDSILFITSTSRIMFYHFYTLFEYIVISSLLFSWEPTYRRSFLLIISLGFLSILFARYTVDLFFEAFFLVLLTARIWGNLLLYNISGISKDIRFWFSFSSFIYFVSCLLVFIEVRYLTEVHAVVNTMTNIILMWGMYASRININQCSTGDNSNVNTGKYFNHNDGSVVFKGQ